MITRLMSIAALLFASPALFAADRNPESLRGGVPLFALLEKSDAGFRFTKISFSKPASNAVPWVELMSAAPMFFTGTEQNCAVGKAVGNVQVRARLCESLVPELFRVEKKSGSQKLTNVLGALSSVGMSGSLRMTDITFDAAAFEKAFNEADANLGISRSMMKQQIEQAEAGAVQLATEFALSQQTVQPVSARHFSQLNSTWKIGQLSPEGFATFLDGALLIPLRDEVERSRQAEVVRQQQVKAALEQRRSLLAQFPPARVTNNPPKFSVKRSWPLVDVRNRANAGDLDAQEELGRRLWNGEGIDEDDSAAALWFTKAAKLGHSGSRSRLGAMYLDGAGGLEKDEVLAEALIRGAAEADDSYGQANLGNLYLTGRGGLVKDEVQAELWIRKSANGGNPFGQWLLGDLYSDGKAVERSTEQALLWHEKAATQGYTYAEAQLGYAFLEGDGVKKDYAKAFSLLSSSANRGDAGAQNNLGVMYMEGLGVARNLANARAWFERASAKGYEMADENLRRMAHNSGLSSGGSQESPQACFSYCVGGCPFENGLANPMCMARCSAECN